MFNLKYFHKLDCSLFETENVPELLKRADKRPEKFIRIFMDGKDMKLCYKDHAEFDLHEAILFFWDRDGQIFRYDFNPMNYDRTFYAAIDPKSFVAYSLGDEKFPREALCMFDSCECIMGIFKTDDSTVVIIYDGSEDYVGYGYYLEKEGYPKIFEKLYSLFSVSQPVMDVEEGIEAV